MFLESDSDCSFKRIFLIETCYLTTQHFLGRQLTVAFRTAESLSFIRNNCWVGSVKTKYGKGETSSFPYHFFITFQS